ncbi:tRNA lysidine(34) synthetase TilS [Staphylococcus debuckii]|uniref:tRNA lysidine(34) synthetase TilS n=1 Tax=Staphylococcus debuckii TaxID=2044912 RepID=UPI003C717BAB
MKLLNIYTQGWTENDHIALAVSTGVDSMVLLNLLTTELSHTYRKLTVLHVNHGIREASKEEETFIRAYCKDHHIPLHVHHLDLSELTLQGKSIQSKAREQRYAWFMTQMAEVDANVLMTAHHQDDQLETIFYRIMTGRTTRSPLGMSEKEAYSGIRLVRPLLNVSKAKIRAYQQRHRVPYHEDASNEDNHYVRNDIRNRLFPAIEENSQLDVAQLLKLKHWHDEQFQSLQIFAEDFIARHTEIENEQITVDRAAFNQLNHSQKTTIMDKLLNKWTEHQPISEHAYREWFTQLENSTVQAVIYSTDKWNIQIVYDKFIIMGYTDIDLTPKRITQPGHYQFGTYQIIINNTLDNTDFPMTLRIRQQGDRFALPHHRGHQKVNRLMINRKVPAYERDRLPILLNKQGEIVAVGSLYTAPNYEKKLEITNLGV